MALLSVTPRPGTRRTGGPCLHWVVAPWAGRGRAEAVAVAGAAWVKKGSVPGLPRPVSLFISLVTLVRFFLFFLLLLLLLLVVITVVA